MKLVVIDYGLGNIRSVIRALEHIGSTPTLSSKPQDIESADKCILLGVGAFADGMAGLESRNLVAPIHNFVQSGKPLLGICLGMQMFFEESEEFGIHKGLGLISGKVKKIPTIKTSGEPHKVPHIGWSPLVKPENINWDSGILKNIKEESSVYFVHSFAGYPTDESNRLADTYYNGQKILAACRKGNVSGCQFHPEKSGEIGLEILKNFTMD